MGLFFCYECKREKLSLDDSNYTNSSIKLMCSSNTTLQKIQKSNTFSEKGNSTSVDSKKNNNKYKYFQRCKTPPLGKTKKKKVKLEDFDIIRLIGIGTYGKVYVASKDSKDKLYAIKVLNKSKINTKILKRNINTERTLLANINHPFIMKLNYAFQTKQSLYFITKFMHGGELNYHIYNEKNNYFSEEKTKFYAAEIILGLQHLHQNNCIYRDLKPENVLIDKNGHIKLTDFGLSKLCEGFPCKGNSLCGTPEYLAPEILFEKNYGIEVDWWSLGVIIYEMLSGYLPFRIISDEKITKNVYKKKIKIFNHFSNSSKDLVKKLLEYNPRKRLGFQQILVHPFFKGIDWDKLERKELAPPFIPEIEENNIFKYFNTENELNAELNTHEKKNKMFYRSENEGSNKNNLFDIEYNNSNNIINTDSNKIDEEGNLILNKCDNCKYFFNQFVEDDNNNENDNEEELNNYKSSDLNFRKIDENLNFNNINYYPGFSFSTLNEDENKINV